jgi:nitroreductase/RimJ/RimL family protein N-acetyltransferase
VEIMIKGKKTIIRPIALEDAEVFTKWWNNGEVMNSVGYPDGLGITEKEVRKDFEKEITEREQGFPNQRRFVILNRETGQPAGEISFSKRDYKKRSVNIGIKIGEPSEQGKGLGKDALQIFMNYLYERYNLRSIQLDTLAENLEARRFYKDLGFEITEKVSGYWTDPEGKERDVIFMEHRRASESLVKRLEKRCSVRDFAKEPVAEEIIDEILEAGRLAPSGGNEQSWKFALVKNRKLMEKIADNAYNQVWMLDAAFIIVLVTNIVPDEKGGRDVQLARYPEFEERIENLDLHFYGRINQEEHQTKIPGTLMMLAALEHGVGSSWVSYFNVNKLQKILGLPQSEIPSEILVFGYPQRPMKSTVKKPMESILLRYE